MPSPEQSDKSGLIEDQAPMYEHLKSWYLAGLRKQALELHDKNLTPAGLIHADRNLIENLVLDSAAIKGTTQSLSGSTPLPLSSLLIYSIFLQAALFFVLLLLQHGHFLETIVLITRLTLGPLVLQGGGPQQFVQVGSLTIVVPMLSYALPCLRLMLYEQQKIHSIGNSLMQPGQKNLRIIRNILIAMVVLLPWIASFLILGLIEQPSLASVRVWHTLLAVAVWSNISIGIVLFCFLRFDSLPLQVVSSRLCSVKKKAQLSSSSTLAVEQLLDELIQARDELASRETLIADAATDLLLAVNQDEQILACNWTSQNLLGLLPEEMTSKKLSDLILPDDLSSVRESLSTSRSNMHSVKFDCRILTTRRDAIDLRCKVEYSATHDCYFVSSHDITDKKTLARSKKEFISMLGHDIRLPLSSSLIAVQVLEQGLYGDLPDAANQTLLDVEKSLKRLIALLQELLEFEEQSAGKMKLSIGSLDTASLLDEALAETSGQALKKSITVKVDAEKIQIEGDYGKLLRVMVNLISNAIKFSPEQTAITVTVKRARLEHVVFGVKDEGPGIAPEYQKLIFERYERLQSTSCEEGSGLGLAIAKAIVESHGGIIGVKSKPGQGSTFWFTLPSSFR